ncbi:hypothetical protein [Cryptosporangium aurantiacum]|uniref:Nucleoside phosphorylase n=1 Tax=Cryptosporangium aurantiacum TaxID=134849 RepID=A0A1M7RLG4_9ACTN|nr:hypothetical protein [Cryptosporangium aurantiacum]SHN47143.1 Nucleoside phosphorylase [Cryptosporangium aurantiacum]
MAEMFSLPGGALSFAECRAIATAVRASQHGREAIRSARGTGTGRLFRDRGPLPLMLYVAGRDGYLARTGEQDVALVRPPLGARGYRLGGGPWLAVLRFADAQWNHLASGGPPAVLLLLALAAGLTGSLLATLLLVLLALAWSLTSMLSFLLPQLGGLTRRLPFWRSPPGPDLSGPRGDNWVMVLGHTRDQDAEDAQRLLRAAQQRAEMLVAASIQRAARRQGGRVTKGAVGVYLDVLRAGLTNDALREAVGAQANRVDTDGTDDSMHVLGPRDHGPGKPHRVVDAGGFFFLYLAACVVAIAVLATQIAEFERAACGQSCADRPATYGSAVEWSIQMFLGYPMTDVSAATLRVQVYGYLLRVMFLVGIAVAVAAILQAVRAVRFRREVRETQEAVARTRKRALLLVTSDVEHRAVLAAVHARNHHRGQLIPAEQEVLVGLGHVGNIEVVLGRTGQSDVGVHGAGLVTASLIGNVTADYVIAVGICYGLRPDPDVYADADLGVTSYSGWQRIGDVCVSQQIALIDHLVRYREADGTLRTLRRGDTVSASAGSRLLSAANALGPTWTRADVRPGLLLSSSTLRNDPEQIRELRNEFPDAIGGEMEAAGVYAAAARRQIGWLVVKAISDWGFGRGRDEKQLQEDRRLAAGNAAEFVVHLLDSGALDALHFESSG